mmetsp:Transcript_13088/g.21422  ORF Transcript_13088/g.21422 Transcript_13088/m.21422 type:complete len:299 (+) Transcript_13088:132-1028(+)|eukprot:CAMPEP_0114433650 /NCGR_PEP_ID=MMETSP0103-20121206/11808_1 /TAXON_ID=37642 ORGANISM="Paraphysomonas imperforata, Strain PA2" /NCGR_SAMPLE_ID=MMETSP0103 /ASSEMBLY_ACC=CAM_ASM_000201 /LENGTH=298 /DNA_ID=CAMNT_0001603419 /DNA_START=110 /DNA_END=1006 /DNA_ORIENTATION=+
MEDENPAITVHLKAPTGDTEISCHANDTVMSLRESVIRQLSAHGKNVRLIFSGKMLDVDQNPLSKYGISDGSFIHAVVTSMRGPVQQQRQATPAQSVPIVYRGFDRLTQLGLSIDETAALRSSFNSQVDAFIEERSSAPSDGEDRTAFRFRMEEEWIASQGARSEFTMNLPTDRIATTRRASQVPAIRAGGANYPMSMATFSFARDEPAALVERPSNPGTMNDFFWGLAMGFGLGILMLFCVWDRNISHKQKMGILTGVFFHIIGGLMQQNYEQQQQSGGRMGQSSNPTEIVFEDGRS